MSDPFLSEYFRALAKMRRNPYKGFKDNPEAARRAGKIGGYNRWHNAKKKDKSGTEDDPEKGHDPKEDEPTQETPQWQ